MTCSEYELLISALADGELDERREADVRAHISTCKSCAGVYGQYLSMQKNISLALADCGDLPDHLPGISHVVKPRQRCMYGRLWAAAAALIDLVLGAYSYMQVQEPVRTPLRSTTSPKVAKMPYAKLPKLNTNKPASKARPVMRKPKLCWAAAKQHIPKSQAKHVASIKSKPAPVSVETAQISVEYVDTDVVQPSASYVVADQISQMPPVPDNHMLGTVVARGEIISPDSVRTQKQCYRLLHLDSSQENLNDTENEGPLQ
jgi:hypothetical protein